jgi:hypothetical protein
MLAALMLWIEALERDAAILGRACGGGRSRCTADLLRASLLGTRASLDIVSDRSALTDAERVIDAVDRPCQIFNLRDRRTVPAAARARRCNCGRGAGSTGAVARRCATAMAFATG